MLDINNNCYLYLTLIQLHYSEFTTNILIDQHIFLI